MKKGLIIAVSLAAILLLVIVYFVLNSVLAEKVTIRGELTQTKGGMGVVNGTLLTDYEKIQPYVGKNVEVTGYIYNPKCHPNSQCFNGPYMDKIMSIRVLD